MSVPLVDVMTSDNPFAAAEWLHGIVSYMRGRRPWRFSAWSALRIEHAYERVQTTRADAMIAITADRTLADMIRQSGKPAVNLMELAVQDLLPVVALDDHAVGVMAGEHLVGLGHRRLAYAGVDFASSRVRLAGLSDVCQRCHIPCITLGDEKPPRWREAMETTILRDWLSELPRPSGVLAFNDQIAQRLVEFCEQLGIRVPDELAILGVDNNVLRCDFSPLTISSIDPGLGRMGFAAAELLDRLMQGHPPPTAPSLFPPVGVVDRRTTDVLAFDSTEVQAAVRFIRERAVEGIEVEDVLKVVHMSRTSLEKKMHAAIGRTPGEEIRRVRLAHAVKLLVETELPMVEVSTSCGFAYLGHFSAAFKTAFAMPPSTYRRRFRVQRGPSTRELR